LEDHDLHIYSAGAVAPPLKKAINLFESKFKARCNLTVGKPHDLLVEIASLKSGDVIACGAEYILDDAEDQGLVVKGSRKSLGLRRSVIVVPVGNPAKIASLDDLCRDGARIGIATEGCLKGVWEDISGKAGVTDKIRRNITHHADACGTLMSLIHEKKVDAVFGWNAFRFIWPNTCELVELPADLQVFRSTAAATVSFTKDPQLSQKFIDFLSQDKVMSIYSDYGWIRVGSAPS
jgi:accessory colonization factor AcfC